MIDYLIDEVRDGFAKEFVQMRFLRTELMNAKRLFLFAARILDAKGNPNADQFKHRAAMCDFAINVDPEKLTNGEWVKMNEVERQYALTRLHNGLGWDQPGDRPKVDRFGQYEMEFDEYAPANEAKG